MAVQQGLKANPIGGQSGRLKRFGLLTPSLGKHAHHRGWAHERNQHRRGRGGRHGVAQSNLSGKPIKYHSVLEEIF